MALLNRLFPSKKKTQKQGYVPFGRNDSVSWKPFNFSKEQVRLLLFRECDARGRKLLFDSSAVQKTPLESPSCSKLKFGTKSKCDVPKKTEMYVEVTNGFGYQYLKPNSDVFFIGEMIFGAVAMTFKGMTLKVHSMKSPDRLMCTKVFHAPVVNRNCKRKSNQSIESSGSSISSINEFVYGLNSSSESKLASGSSSGPLDVPHSEESLKVPASSMEGDSGFCGDASLHSMSSISSSFWGPYPSCLDSLSSSLSTLSNNSGGSLASLQRRWVRNVSTSLETDSVNSSWQFSEQLDSSTSDDVSGRPLRKTQLGLSFILTLPAEEEKDLEIFFFEHMAVMESLMERLQCCVEKAYAKKDMFVHLMMESFLEVQQCLSDLFTAPRLANPVWVGLALSTDMHRSCPRFQFNLASTFLRDFCQLIAALDTKATNFFISTLVSAVLTHHLGWVATVLPAKGAPNNATKPPCAEQMFSDLAKSHPYNALWAQLGDLMGAAGQPLKVARTVVTANGKKSDLLSKLLNILSYFIRCSSVERKMNSRFPTERDNDGFESLVEAVTSATLNSSTASTCTIVPQHNVEPPLHATGSVISDKTINLNFEEAESSISELRSPSKENSVTSPLKQSGLKKSFTFINNLNSSESSKENVENLNSKLYPEEGLLHPDVISEKVSRLCRVPANAVLYHMSGEENKLKSVENLLPKKVDCEKQFSAADMRLTRDKCSKVHEFSKENKPILSRAEHEAEQNLERGKEGVVFVLGDSDELVNLKTQSGTTMPKSKSDNVLSSDSESVLTSSFRTSGFYPSLEGLELLDDDNVLNTASCVESRTACEASRPNLKSDLSSFRGKRAPADSKTFPKSEECALDSGIVLDEPLTPKLDNRISESVFEKVNEWHERIQCEKNDVNVSLYPSLEENDVRPLESESEYSEKGNTVTIRSSVIKVKGECSCNASEMFPAVEKKEIKQVGRSQSLSLPLNKNKTKKKSSTICRRHSENMHQSERYLRDYHSVRFNFERCDGVLNNYLDRMGAEKSPETENISFKLNEARENFEFQEKYNHSEQESSQNTVLRHANTCSHYDHNLSKFCEDQKPERREGNAIFDEYGTSDDELLSSSEIQGGDATDQHLSGTQEELATLVELPLPRHIYSEIAHGCGIASSMLAGVVDHYMPDMVLHGCTQMLPQWEMTLKRDLIIAARHSLLDQEVAEAVCIVGNAELWEVQLVSSHVSIVDKPGTVGIRVGMSQLVANMLESLLHLWKLKTPPDQCLQHLESKMRELCLRSQALAEFLLTTDFCDMATLTTSLGLEANDVPLLLAIASTHTPQVTAHYGLSFR